MSTLFFECKVALNRQTEDGATKNVKENYLVKTDSFTEAEARLTEKLGTEPEFTVKSIKKSDIDVVIESEGEYYYKYKVDMITLDEKSGKERHFTITHLAKADNFAGAFDVISKYLYSAVHDYNILSITQTAILDCF